MTVVPLKKYKSDDWVRIATQNNSTREQHALTPWSGEDIWALYLAFFG